MPHTIAVELECRKIFGIKECSTTASSACSRLSLVFFEGANAIRREIVVEFGSQDDYVVWRDTLRNECNPKRDFLVFLCPGSGKGIFFIIDHYNASLGQATRLWESVSKPLFDLAGISYTVIETTGIGHCQTYVKDYDFDSSPVDGIVVAGGDGVLHEAVNGLLSRDDWQKRRLVPVGQIPCGSGNSFARSVYNATNVLQATVSIIQSRAQGYPHDAISVRGFKTGKLVYSVSNIGWSFPADTDIISEKYRELMGNFRFQFVAVADTFSPCVYKGRFTWLPGGSDPDAEEGEGTGRSMVCTHTESCPECNVSGNENDAIFDHDHPSHPIRHTDKLTALSESELASMYDDSSVIQHPFRRKYNRSCGFGSPIVHIPANKGVPDAWKRCLNDGDADGADADSADDWISVDSPSWRWWFVSNQSYISQEMMSHPYAHDGDGTCDVEWVKDDGPGGRVSFFRMIQWYLQSEAGTHIHNPITGYAKMKSFVLEPGDRTPQFEGRGNGFVVIDGEDFGSYEPLLCDVHKGLVRVFK